MLFFVGMRFKRAGERQRRQQRAPGRDTGRGSFAAEEETFSKMANFILPNHIDTDIATLSKEACEWFVTATESSRRALVSRVTSCWSTFVGPLLAKVHFWPRYKLIQPLSFCFPKYFAGEGGGVVFLRTVVEFCTNVERQKRSSPHIVPLLTRPHQWYDPHLFALELLQVHLMIEMFLMFLIF